MKKIYFVFAFLLALHPLRSQTWAWADYQLDHSPSVIYTATNANEDIAVTGYYMNQAIFGPVTLTATDGNYLRPFIAKRDGQGNYLWAKTLTEDPVGYSISYLTIDPQGNTYVALRISTINTTNTITIGGITHTFDPSIQNQVLTKFSADGEMLWSRLYAGTDVLKEMVFDADNNMYLGVNFVVPVTFGSQTFTPNQGNFVIAKYDTSDNLIWTASPTQSEAVYVSTFNLTPEGNIAISGEFATTLNYGNGTIAHYGPENEGNRFILMLSADGENFSSGVNLGALNLQLLDRVLVAQDGVYFSGLLYFEQLQFGPITLTLTGQENSYIGKTDFQGNVLWAKNFDFGTSAGDEPMTTLDPSGGIYMTQRGTGNTASVDGIPLPISTANHTTIITKLGPDGNAIWAKKTQGSADVLYVAVSANANSFYFSGRPLNAGSIILDNNTFQSVNTFWQTITGKLQSSLAVENPSDAVKAVAYPNPATDVLTISNSENSSFTIYDNLGRSIHSGQTLDGRVDVSSLTKGAYLIKTDAAKAIPFLKN